jgi:hypothetical protein
VNARVRTLLQLLLAAVFVVAAGCKDRPYPCKFNNMMARTNLELSKAGKEFFATVTPLSRGEAVNPTNVRSAYANMESLLKKKRAEWDETGPPMGTSWGSALMDRYVEFLDSEQSMLDKIIKPIVETVENQKLDVASQWAIIKPLLEKVEPEESATREPLKQVQAKFAEEHRMKLE